MSLLIKGLEMPSGCEHCPFCIDYWATDDKEEWRCIANMHLIEFFDTRLDSCPLIEVPPHGRLIDADELKEWIAQWFAKHKYYHPYSKSNDIPIPEVYDILEQMPPVDVVEQKAGKWIEYGEPDPWNKFQVWYWKCSECGAVGIDEWSYCPHCGARMVSDGRKQTKDT